MQIKSTADLSVEDSKALIYGEAGAGKTTLIATLEAPLVLSTEAGLLSLRDLDIDYLEIKSFEELELAYNFIATDENAKAYKTIVLDSVSEMAEVVLAHEKESQRNTKDGFKVWGALEEKMRDILKKFRDLSGFYIVFIAKMDREKDKEGRLLYAPWMPGNALKNALPYFFDHMFRLHAEKNPEGEVVRTLQTEADGVSLAKCRQGLYKRVDFWEPADLGLIFSKLQKKKKELGKIRESGDGVPKKEEAKEEKKINSKEKGEK